MSRAERGEVTLSQVSELQMVVWLGCCLLVLMVNLCVRR